MKKTARFLIVLLVVLMSLALFSGQALASTFDHCASALQAMGLFKGTATGFELDRQATRAEGAVMLVRLLGAEEKALASNYSHPFTDVPAWASPHIGYMYENGLTKGTSATTFTPQGICDLQMFSTFILRALGYTEAAGDFTYAEAADFARELGLVDIYSGSGDFKRDNMAAISYTALFAPPKGAKSTLLAQLIEQGAVDEGAAKPYLALFADFVQMNKVALPEYQAKTPMEIKLNLAMNMDMGEEGKADIKYDALLKLDASAVGEIESLGDVITAVKDTKIGMTNQASVIGGTPDDPLDMDVKLNLYLLGGVLYLDTDLGAVAGLPIPEKMKLDIDSLVDMMDLGEVDLNKVSLDEFLPLFYSEMQKDFPTLNIPDNTTSLPPVNPNADYYSIAWLKSIKFTEIAGGNKRIDITYINLSTETNVSMENTLVSFFLDKNGALTGLKMDMSMTVSKEDQSNVKVTLQMECHITKAGKEVKITLPGKAGDYIDMSELLRDML